MGYCLVFPAYQVGGSKKLWGIMYYGLSGLWNKRASTVQYCSIGCVASYLGLCRVIFTLKAKLVNRLQ